MSSVMADLDLDDANGFESRSARASMHDERPSVRSLRPSRTHLHAFPTVVAEQDCEGDVVGGAARASRGAVVGLVVIALAATAHLLGGGRAEAPSSGFVLLSVLCIVACAALSRREWTLGRLLVCLGASQLVFHAVLGAEHDAAALHWVGPHAASAGTMHGGAVLVPPADLATAMPSSSPSMLVAHVAAVILSALILRHGEQLQLRIVELFAWLLRGFTFEARPRVRARCAPRIGEVAGAVLRTQTWLTSLRRRGPPWVDDPTAWSITPVAASLSSP
jgi:hypothetical protein